MSADAEDESYEGELAVSPKALQDMSGGEIKRAVAEKYSQVAEAPGGKFNFPVGRAFAESVGYPPGNLG